MEMTLFQGTAWFAAISAGFFGGPHCIMMCGGYVAALSQLRTKPEAAIPTGCPRRSAGWQIQLAAHLGRMCSYIALGTLLGLLGRWAFEYVIPIQRGLATLAALVLIVLALAIARGGLALPWLERMGLHLQQKLSALFGRILHGNGLLARFGLGLLWGLTPCGLVYAALSLALVAGSAGQGALVMLAFWLGTLPVLLLSGVVLQRFRHFFHQRWLRYLVALVIIGFALLTLNKLWFSDKMNRHMNMAHPPSATQTATPPATPMMPDPSHSQTKP